MATPWRLFWLLVLAGHTVAAAAWWWLMPGGFPPSHPRFWSNGVAPIAVLAVVATAVWAARRGRFARLRLSLIPFPMIWAAAAVAARVVFPISFGRLFVLPLAGAGLMGAAAFLTFRKQGPAPCRAMLAVAAVATLVGTALPCTQRAPFPDTWPLNAPMPEVVADQASVGRMLAEIPGSRLRIHPGDGSVTVQAGALRVSIQPVLRFLSRSPDGCWTILASPPLRDGPDLLVRSVHHEADRLALHYRADYQAILRVDPGPEGGPIRLEATARLPHPIFSQLDQGVARARVVFDDWSAQAGTAPSPAAGWGVPVNAIEFSLAGDRPGSPAGIYITLAGTSVGRGWDSVGHAAGTYRNRIRIEVLGTPVSGRFCVRQILTGLVRVRFRHGPSLGCLPRLQS